MKKIIRTFLVLGIVCSLFGCAKKKTDIISGHKWQASDGSVIVFLNNGEYYWYKDVDVEDDNYYHGTYTIYNGEKAIEFIAVDISFYEVTREDQENFIANATGATIKEYYCIALNIESLILNGVETV